MSLDDSEATARLQERIDALEAQIHDLRSALQRELKTNRIAVVDENGDDRVVVSADRRTGSVLVKAVGPDGHTTGSELFAAEDPQGGDPEIGLCLIKDGTVVARWREG